MKYLLVGINAKYIHSNLALHSLKSYAGVYSTVTPVVHEYTINMPISDIIHGIYSEAPDFIGFSTYIWNVEIIKQIIRDIKQLLPDTVIFLGGPEVSYDSKNILEDYPEITGIMLGEGEHTFVELIKYYEHEISSLQDIKGLFYYDSNSNEYVSTPVRNPIDLSTVPFPYEDINDFENRIIYYETSRGCPFGCSYCLSSVDKTLRFRDLELVKKEFKIFLEANVPQVKLVDRTFNIDHKRSISMLNFIRDNDNGITNFHFEIAGDILTDEEIDIIQSLRPGLIQLEIGVQSTNDCTLRAINRHTNLERLKNNVAKLLKNNNVHLHLDLIAGLPYEDLSSFKQSFNQVYSMGSHELQLGFLKLLKGAPINHDVKEQNIIYSSFAPYEVLSTKYLSYENICELKRAEEMLEIYHNSCQFSYSEKFLLDLEKSPYDMYYNLSKYYQEKNQLVIQCKRVIRYELLLNYAIEKHAITIDMENHLRYLLTLDYYCRERAKARPAFALPIDKYKSEIRRINEQLSLTEPNTQFHVEPEYGSDRFVIFNYSKKSVITSNVLIDFYPNSISS